MFEGPFRETSPDPYAGYVYWTGVKQEEPDSGNERTRHGDQDRRSMRDSPVNEPTNEEHRTHDAPLQEHSYIKRESSDFEIVEIWRTAASTDVAQQVASTDPSSWEADTTASRSQRSILDYFRPIAPVKREET